METAGLAETELEYLLWDRILHRILAASGKRVIVDKTPQNLWCWQRIADCWRDARFVFMLRHPAHVLASAFGVDPARRPEDTTDLVLRMFDAVEDARQALAGVTVRYEELTADPVPVMRGLTVYLDIDWEPGMLEYGRAEHGPLVPGIGDFGEKIRTGRIVPDRALPAGPVPDPIRAWCARWGYEFGQR